MRAPFHAQPFVITFTIVGNYSGAPRRSKFGRRARPARILLKYRLTGNTTGHARTKKTSENSRRRLIPGDDGSRADSLAVTSEFAASIMCRVRLSHSFGLFAIGERTSRTQHRCRTCARSACDVRKISLSLSSFSAMWLDLRASECAVYFTENKREGRQRARVSKFAGDFYSR